MRIIIAGAESTGIALARYLRAENHDLVLIDSNACKLKDLSEQLDIQTLVGNPAYPSVMETAGGYSTDVFVAATDSDEVNMVACSVAKSVFNIPKRIARISSPEFTAGRYSSFLQDLSVEAVVAPEKETAMRIIDSLPIPSAVDVTHFADGKAKFIGLRCQENSPLNGKTLQEIYVMTEDTGMVIVALVRRGESLSCDLTRHVHSGDEVYFVVPEKRLIQILDTFGYEYISPKHIVIFGGGRVGWHIAKSLEANDGAHYVSVIEENTDRAKYIAGTLDSTLVIQGDALDETLEEEVNLKNYKIAIATTGNDETNILLSLLSKRSGVERTCSLIHNPLYHTLIAELGVDSLIDPNSVVVSSILQHIRKGRIQEDYFVQSGIGEMLEIEAVKTSKITRLPLGRLKIPEGIVIAGVLRKNTYIPATDKLFVKDKDRVLAFVGRGQVQKLEKLFSVAFSFFGADK